jgi:hypothetical protein
MTMNIYIDPATGQEWHLDDISMESLLPSGSVRLSDSEVMARRVGALSDAQIAACNAIDTQAGNTRLKYITNVPGQAETYLQKAQDAAIYKAASYPSANIADYPYVRGYAIALYGATPSAAQYQAAAADILATQAIWIAKGAQIEQARSTGKVAVMACAAVNPLAMTANELSALHAVRDAAIAALAAL